jgi:hypothetical protein
VVIIRRAIADDENRHLRQKIDFSARRSYAQAVSMVAAIALAGLSVQLAGPGGWFALCAVLVANGALTAQILIIRQYWNASLVEPFRDPDS